jgi:phospholipid transport system substrate-binding protein
MKRRALIAIAVLTPFAGVAARAAAGLPAAADPIAALNAGLLEVMRAAPSTPFQTRMDTLLPVVERAFDLPQILRNSVGPRWSSFPPEQQNELLDAFSRFTVASWVANFDSFDGQRFEILPDVRMVGSDQIVHTRITPRSGDPTRLDYVMRDTDGSWKAIDILLNGSISRVAVQRSDFRSQLSGGSPAPLIAMLRDKVTALAAGAKS